MDLKKLFRQCLCTEQSISTCAVCLLCILIITLLTPILARNVPNILIIGTMAAFVVCVLPRVLYLRQRDK